MTFKHVYLLVNCLLCTELIDTFLHTCIFVRSDTDIHHTYLTFQRATRSMVNGVQFYLLILKQNFQNEANLWLYLVNFICFFSVNSVLL